MEAKKDVTALAFSSDGNLLASGDEKGFIHCWDIARKVSITELKQKGEILFLDFLSGDKTIVAVDESGNTSVFGLPGGAQVSSSKTGSRPRRVSIDRGKRYLAVATNKERIELYDSKARMPAGEIDARGDLDDLVFLGFDRLGEQLIAITKKANVVVWNPSTQQRIREVSLSSEEMHGSKSVIHSASTNRASNIFVVGLQEVARPKGGLKGTARPSDLLREDMVIAFDWKSGFEVKRVKYPDGIIEEIALGPGNDHVAIINNRNNKVTLVDLRKGELRSSVVTGEKPGVLAVSGNDRWLAAGSEDGQVSLWEIGFRGAPTAETITQTLPTLSGRIRTDSPGEPALEQGVPVTLALLNFEANGISQSIADVCMDLMSSALANIDYVTLVERNRIQDIINELKFQMTGLTEQNGVEVGRILSADKVLLCSVGTLGTSYLFNARIIDVETAQVIQGRLVICEECRDQDLYDAVNLLVSTIAH